MLNDKLTGDVAKESTVAFAVEFIEVLNTELAGRLSALMMSAAFKMMLAEILRSSV